MHRRDRNSVTWLLLNKLQTTVLNPENVKYMLVYSLGLPALHIAWPFECIC